MTEKIFQKFKDIHNEVSEGSINGINQKLQQENEEEDNDFSIEDIL